jgi:hypothetical protein
VLLLLLGGHVALKLAELAEFLALLVDLLARVLPSLEDGFGALEAVLRPRRVVGFGLNLGLRLRLGGLLEVSGLSAASAAASSSSGSGCDSGVDIRPS